MAAAILPRPCRHCNGLGFTDCPEALVEVDGKLGVAISIAWAKAVPCTCAAGALFLIQATEWNRQADPPPMTRDQWIAAQKKAAGSSLLATWAGGIE